MGHWLGVHGGGYGPDRSCVFRKRKERLDAEPGLNSLTVLNSRPASASDLSVFIGFSLVFFAYPLWDAEDRDRRPKKIWQTLVELSEEGRIALDMGQDTPHDAKIPYLGAEAYPFRALYTAYGRGNGLSGHGISSIRRAGTASRLKIWNS